MEKTEENYQLGIDLIASKHNTNTVDVKVINGGFISMSGSNTSLSITYEITSEEIPDDVEPNSIFIYNDELDTFRKRKHRKETLEELLNHPNSLSL